MFGILVACRCLYLKCNCMKSSRLLSLCFVLFPILDIYGVGVPGITIGKLALLILIFNRFLRRPFNFGLTFDSRYVQFMSILCMVPFLMNCLDSWFSFSGYFHKLIGVAGFVITFGFVNSYVNWDEVLRLYRKVVYVCIAFFLFQEFFANIVHVRVPGIIPGIPLVTGEDSEVYIAMQQSISRSCSFFLEPTYFAYYISIYLVLTAVKQVDFWKNRELIFLSVVFLLIRSGNGFMVLSLTWLAVIIRALSIQSTSKRMKTIFVSMIVTLCVASLLSSFLQQNYFKRVLTESRNWSLMVKQQLLVINVFMLGIVSWRI